MPDARFYATMAPHYDAIFPLKRAQLGFVAERLPDGARVLDIGCATGALSVALALRGHAPLGVDLDAEMVGLARARARAEGAQLPVRFDVADMTRLGQRFGPATFDAALCLGNTLVHLTQPAAIGSFLADLRRLLRPGGVFVMQIINYQRLLAAGEAGLPTIDNEQVRFERRYGGLEAGVPLSFDTTLTVKASGEVLRSSVPLYPLTSAELTPLLEAAGFRSVERFGAWSGVPFEAGASYPLIVVARG